MDERRYSVFNHICDGCLLRHDPTKAMVMVVTAHSTYLDASGHPSDKKILCVGGFMATQDRWNDFGPAWRKCLSDHGIEYPFHATDFFRDFHKNRKFAYIQGDLVRVIANHVTAGFSASIDIDAYKITNSFYRIEEILGTPYALATRNLYDNFRDWKKSVGFTHPNLFFAAKGTLHEGDMRECLASRDSYDPPIGVNKDLEPCQAADLYAYAMYQHWNTGQENDLLNMFNLKIAGPKERFDTIMLAPNFDRYVTTRNVTFTHAKFGDIVMPIPSRKESVDADFRFVGDKKRVRIRRIKDK